MSAKARAFVALVGVLGAFLVVSVFLGSDLSHLVVSFAILFAASFFSQIYELEILPKWGLSTQIAISVASIYIGGLYLGVWVTFLSTLVAEIILRWDKLKINFWEFFYPIVFNLGQIVLSVAAAALIFQFTNGHAPPYHSLHGYVPVVLAFFAYVIVNNSLVSGIIALTTEHKFSYILRFSLKNLHLQFLTMGVIAILIAILYSTSQWNLILALVPLFLVHFSMRNYLRLRRDSHTAFKHVTDLLSERDPYTGQHSEDVEVWVTRLAEALGLSEEVAETVKMGAAIHDIGKIAVPDAILRKAGTLNEEEWEVMKRHPLVAAEIIGDLEIYRDVVPIVCHEHEHWDGSGYPTGLAGDAIPLGARIVAVADVYSALTTERAYRPPQGKPLKYTCAEACEILRDMAGTTLDPHLVTVFTDKILPQQEAV